MSKGKIKDPDYAVDIAERTTMCLRYGRVFHLCLLLLVTFVYAAGCAHYPTNKPLKEEDSQRGYKGSYTPIADNLGLRALLDRVIARGSVWEFIKGTPLENVNKIVLIIVNAETAPDTRWSTSERIPPFSAMVSSYSSIAIERYNEETIALLKENVELWADEIKTQRCRGGAVSTAPGSCGDIQFYVVEVKFNLLEDGKERMYFKRLPTTFKLKPEQVDRLREAAHLIMNDSPEFQRLLNDLR